MAVKQVLIILFSINAQSNDLSLDEIHLYSDDEPSNEAFHLSFSKAQFYAKCYPQCDTEPILNPLNNKPYTTNKTCQQKDKLTKFTAQSNENHSISESKPILFSNSDDLLLDMDQATKSTKSKTDTPDQTPVSNLHKALSTPLTNAFFDSHEIPKIAFNPNPSVVAYRADYLIFDESYDFDLKQEYMNDRKIAETFDVDSNRHPNPRKPKFRIPSANSMDSALPIIICDDMETFCPGGTCCKMDNDHYGCCPYLAGTCCGNKVQCCPNGYQCVDWPNSVREILRKIFGMTETHKETRCRIDYSTWISNKMEKWSGNDKKVI